jgi:hypothetical protein
MTLAAAAVVPGAPLLVPALAGGSAGVDDALRTQVLTAVEGLLAAPGDELVVVAAAAHTAAASGTWDWSSLGVCARGDGPGPALPLALAVGAWLLDTCGAGPERSYRGVSEQASAGDCADLGARLAAGKDVRLLVVADGTARRSEKAPGHLDPRAQAFDEQVQRALATADRAALLQLDPDLARDLWAAGRAPLQVLAGAAGSDPLSPEVHFAGAPYGVEYVVASWSAGRR